MSVCWRNNKKTNGQHYNARMPRGVFEHKRTCFCFLNVTRKIVSCKKENIMSTSDKKFQAWGESIIRIRLSKSTSEFVNLIWS